MSSPTEFQLTFERLKSGRERRVSYKKSDADGRGGGRDSAASRSRPLTALSIRSRSIVSHGDMDYVEPTYDEHRPRLVGELSMPVMHIMEPEADGSSNQYAAETCVDSSRLCSRCSCRMESPDSEWDQPARPSSRASEGTREVVSIPSFGLEQLNLQHCKSQDEVEAELAKRVGVGLQGQDSISETSPAEQAARDTLSAVFVLLCDAELLDGLATELEANEQASDLAALLTLWKAKTKGLQSDLEAAAIMDMSWGLSAQLLSKVTSRLQGLPMLRANCKSGKKRRLSADEAAMVDEILPLWRRLKQTGWIPDKIPGTASRNKGESRLTSMLNDISSSIDAQRLRNKELLESIDTLKDQLRESRQKSHSFEDRANKYASELERTKKALKSKTDEIRQLESNMEANTAAKIGGVVNEIGSLHQALEESQKAVEILEAEKLHTRRDLEEADKKRQLAERQLAKATEDLKQSTFERRELLAFQTRAANLMREKETTALHARIAELENMLQDAKASLLPADGIEQSVVPRTSSLTRARLQHAVELGSEVELTPNDREAAHPLDSHDHQHPLDLPPGPLMASSRTSSISESDTEPFGGASFPAGSSPPSEDSYSEYTEQENINDLLATHPGRHVASMPYIHVGEAAEDAKDLEHESTRPAQSDILKSRDCPDSREFGSGLKKKLEGEASASLGLLPSRIGARPSTASAYGSGGQRPAQQQRDLRHRVPSWGVRKGGLMAETSAPVLGYASSVQFQGQPHHSVGGGFRPDNAAFSTQARARAMLHSKSSRPSSARPVYSQLHGRRNNSHNTATWMQHGRSAMENLQNMMEPWSNAAQIPLSSGSGRQRPPSAARLNITGMKQARTNGATITCVRATGKVVVLHQPTPSLAARGHQLHKPQSPNPVAEEDNQQTISRVAGRGDLH